MPDDVAEYVRSCPECQRNKPAKCLPCTASVIGSRQAFRVYNCWLALVASHKINMGMIQCSTL